MNSKKRYVICIKNGNYQVDLDILKVYQVVRDAKSEALGFLRIIDESGEDYLYPRAYFVPIALPRTIQKPLTSAR